MRILVLSLNFPYPPHTGTTLRTFNLLKNLSKKHELHVASFAMDLIAPSDIDAMKKYAQTATSVGQPFKNSIPRILSNLFTSQPYKIVQFTDDRFYKCIQKIVSLQPVDLVMIEHLFLGKYAFMKELSGVPKVITAQNIEYRLIRGYAFHGNLAARIYGFLQYPKMRNYERRLYRKFETIITVSELDRQRMAKDMQISSSRITVIDNGVDCKHFYYCGSKRPSQRRIFFSGGDSYPNKESVKFFTQKVFPRLLLSYPDLEFYIVGDINDPGVKRLHDGRRVFVTGRVEDTRVYLKDASVVVVPLKIGGGTRLKILEALSMGKPVVSTSIGCEGLDLENGRDILVADSSEAFAAGILRLFEDEQLYRELSENGRRKIVDFYDWNKISCRLETFLQKFSEGTGVA